MTYHGAIDGFEIFFYTAGVQYRWCGLWTAEISKLHISPLPSAIGPWFLRQFEAALLFSKVLSRRTGRDTIGKSGQCAFYSFERH